MIVNVPLTVSPGLVPLVVGNMAELKALGWGAWTEKYKNWCTCRPAPRGAPPNCEHWRVLGDVMPLGQTFCTPTQLAAPRGMRLVFDWVVFHQGQPELTFEVGPRWLDRLFGQHWPRLKLDDAHDALLSKHVCQHPEWFERFLTVETAGGREEALLLVGEVIRKSCSRAGCYHCDTLRPSWHTSRDPR